MNVGAGSKLIFIGDSITDCGRARPVGEGDVQSLGNGYVSLVAGWLGAVCPEKRVRIVNVGTSGNTVRDLKGRWQTDVFDLDPDWLSVMIGINDVWRKYDSPQQPELHVPLGEYASTLDDLVAATAPRVKGIVIMTPFFIETDRSGAMRAMMDDYGAAAKEIAAKRRTPVADTQAAFDAVLRHVPSTSLAGDRVHPNVIGHTILARAFLRAVGVAVDIA